MLKRFGRDVAIYGGVDLVFKLLQFLLIPVYTAYLSVSEFGILALLQVSALLIGTIAGLGVSYAVQRYYFDDSVSAERRPALVSTGLIQLTASLVASLFLLTILGFALRDTLVSDFGIAWPLALLALATILPDQLTQYTLDTARLQFAPVKFCVIALIKNVLGLLIGVWLLVEARLGLTGLLIGSLAGAWLALPVGLLLVRNVLTWQFDRKYLAELLRFGSPFVLTAAAYWMFSSLDRWMLARLANNVEVGLFSIAFKFASVMTLLITAFQQAWAPTGLRMAQEDPGDSRATFSRILTLWLFLLSVIALALGLFAGEILMLLTPEAYWPAASVFALGGAALALSGTTQVTVLGLTLAKRSRRIALGAWLTAGLNIALNLILIPRFGAYGAAIATLISSAFLTVFYLASGQRHFALPLERGPLAYGLLIIGLAITVPRFPFGAELSAGSIVLKSTVLLAVIAGAIPAGVLDARHVRGWARSMGWGAG
jgi:O-antigen/teichoic acid export membrane protein